MAEQAELESTDLLDLLDTARGIQSLGGSLTEISLMLTAIEH